jgi:hypothetical protein
MYLLAQMPLRCLRTSSSYQSVLPSRNTSTPRLQAVFTRSSSRKSRRLKLSSILELARTRDHQCPCLTHNMVASQSGLYP